MSEKKSIASLLNDESENWFQRYVVSNAPVIMAVFANAVVILSDIRVMDVIYRLTGVWWQAVGASFACAAPFFIWEIAWQYNHTTKTWRFISLVMAAGAIFTSVFLGIADVIFTDPDAVMAEWLLGGVIVATFAHMVVGLLYYYNDPDVARKRNKAQAMAELADQETNALIAEGLLAQGSSLLDVIEKLKSKYSAEDVDAVLAVLQGRKKPKNG